MVEGKFKRLTAFAWRLQGSVQRSGNLKTPNYYLKNTGTEQYNFSTTLAYHQNNFNANLFYSQYNAKVGIFALISVTLPTYKLPSILQPH